MIPSNLGYKSRGVRALVLPHDEHMRRFFQKWQRARACSVILPATEDPSYLSLNRLMRHALGACRGYIVWICDVAAAGPSASALSPTPWPSSREAESCRERLFFLQFNSKSLCVHALKY